MTSRYAAAVLDWYAGHARDLPWRQADATPWSVMVSEFMLQQTPVSRVLPAHAAWLARWPEPLALAGASVADAVRQWDRLGYPRRAVRLHASAQLIVSRHGGVVPSDVADLRALPGVGSYTAAAIASFAFGRRHAVLDTNVRRVLARIISGQGLPPVTPTVAEVRLAESLLPLDGRQAARWSVGVMELGALVCTSTRPRCTDCPLASECAWLRLGRPAAPQRRGQAAYQGSDRQCRGQLLAVLRAAAGPIPASMLTPAWHDTAQRARALAALVNDGLIVRCGDGSLALPGDDASAVNRSPGG
ncbi:MAG TPA: A/G-specific adenine glycosylase [Streptosporangiaceae bacterium]|nr:A/G-specific adenine glycosylase [Streptosporangiaceae bacterium]